MKNLKRSALGLSFLIALLCLQGCGAKDPVSVSGTSNGDVKVATLFEHDGCTTYRFYDAGDYHYYVKCAESKKVTTISTKTESCWKNCVHTYDENIGTVE